jgi:hypothetical protein
MAKFKLLRFTSALFKRWGTLEDDSVKIHRDISHLKETKRRLITYDSWRIRKIFALRDIFGSLAGTFCLV